MKTRRTYVNAKTMNSIYSKLTSLMARSKYWSRVLRLEASLRPMTLVVENTELNDRHVYLLAQKRAPGTISKEP